ncbi:MAG: 16S rRNA (adenine(1518)-N(6)/adenine(1519)-N(6))-dimethyltransferase RsmA [Verrucomicrobiae bacterium]|nr:16S rRNA (adenine(1518)-N(6)/adenine(1519)-N(6))-dimethyltransferase RsmA [Verrucomicrobiae bacterium]
MTLTDTRAALAQLRLRPSRVLGQNFLVDQNIARLVVKAAELRATDTVLEIGPGLGALTEMLLERAGRVVAVEKDTRLAAFLRERFGHRETLQLVHGDALHFDFAAAMPSSFKVVANLPYAISTPLLMRMVESPARPRRMVLTVQREVADRLTAQPRTKDYSALTLFTQLHYEARREHLVSRSCFLPMPTVGSAVVVLRLAPHPLLEPALECPFKQMVRAAFQHRRKMLRGVLPKSGLGGWMQPDKLEAALERLGTPRTARAEELSLAQWLLLTRELVLPATARPPSN